MQQKISIAIILTALLGLWTAGAARADDAASSEELARLELELQIHQIVLESVTEPTTLALEDEKVPARLEEIAQRVLEATSQRAPVVSRSGIARLAGKVRWSTLWKVAKNKFTKVRSSARLNGKAVALWTAVGVGMEILHPIVCMALGISEYYVLTAPFIPGPAVTTTLAVAISRIQMRKRLIALYGGSNVLDELRSMVSDIRRTHGLNRKDDWTVPFTSAEGEQLSLVVSRSGFLGKVMRKIGVRSRGVTLDELSAFLRRRGWENEDLQAFRKISGASTPVRTLLLVHALISERGSDAIQALAEAFPEAVIASENRTPELPGALADWVYRVRAARSWDELRAGIDSITSVTEEVPALAFWSVWKKLILPRLADGMNSGVGLNQFVRMVHESERILAEAEKQARQGDPAGPVKVATFHGALGLMLSEAMGGLQCEVALIP